MAIQLVILGGEHGDRLYVGSQSSNPTLLPVCGTPEWRWKPIGFPDASPGVSRWGFVPPPDDQTPPWMQSETHEEEAEKQAAWDPEDCTDPLVWHGILYCQGQDREFQATRFIKGKTERSQMPLQGLKPEAVRTKRPKQSRVPKSR